MNTVLFVQSIMGATDTRRPVAGFMGTEVIDCLGKTRRGAKPDMIEQKGASRQERD
ncbi:hypothetical protein [Massilia sp.]|uniref:hypothetical protein n=1 Tax=Massilia sp. TaxID=1882437 RepID=UPI00289CC4EE|nr:hypothetical protein [Massilia sp.]